MRNVFRVSAAVAILISAILPGNQVVAMVVGVLCAVVATAFEVVDVVRLMRRN